MAQSSPCSKMDSHNGILSSKKFVGRPTKLDAVELDKEISNVMKNQLFEMAKFLKVGTVTKWEPEIESILQFLLFQLSVNRVNSSIGMQLLGLTFQKPANKRKLMLFALLSIGCRYLKRRHYIFTRSLNSVVRDYLDVILTWIDGTIHFARLINLLVFLREGLYPTLTHRLLGLHMESVGTSRRIGYKYLGRELMWNSFNELLIFLLPMIDLKVISRFIRKIRSSDSIIFRNHISPNISVNSRCVICNENLTWPHCMGCEHIFCYYCLQANIMVDSEFECPVCGFKLKNNESIRRVPV